MKKCKWYNDSKAPVVLTIDDLSFGYLDIQGIGLHPSNDWGFGCRRKESIFSYFEKHLITKYPEVKYTIFLPFGKHSLALTNCGYKGYTGDIFENQEFKDLINFVLSTGNEIAWHGHNHGLKAPTEDTNTWCKEYEQYTLDQYSSIIETDLRNFYNYFGVKINGGRFPCYMYDENALSAINKQSFRWWSFDYNEKFYGHTIKNGILAFPTSFSGNMFNKYPSIMYYPRKLFKELKLARVVQKSVIINITEHFLSTRPDGRRQTPNVFDDINSLDKLFSILRNYDIWYATCSQIANYIDSYENTTITENGPGTFRIDYNGKWVDSLLLTLECTHSAIKKNGTNEIIKGKYKNGKWLFNINTNGVYQIYPNNL
jgi:hypothetical protein